MPSIGLVAPVEQGVSDAVMAVAVGHNPYSVWPGSDGTAVLSAHDVSYFVHINDLHVGSVLRYETPCTSYEFSVTSSKVVTAGTPVYNTAASTVALVTCWPTNALWFTPDRLVVMATEVKVTHLSNMKTSNPSGAADPLTPTVNAPLALVNQGLTLVSDPIPMGTMSIAGSPATSWAQSPAPLDVESSGIEAYIGATKALSEDHLQWWNDLAPHVGVPSAIIGTTAVRYDSGLNVSIAVDGTLAQSVTLSTSVTISGGTHPGTYSLRVVEPVAHGQLHISQWQLVPG